MKERIKLLSKGGYEEIYPEVTEEILTSEHPEQIALEAGLTKRQWECISYYLDDPNIPKFAKMLRIQRANVYMHLDSAYKNLEKRRKEKLE